MENERHHLLKPTGYTGLRYEGVVERADGIWYGEPLYDFGVTGSWEFVFVDVGYPGGPFKERVPDGDNQWREHILETVELLPEVVVKLKEDT